MSSDQKPPNEPKNESPPMPVESAGVDLDAALDSLGGDRELLTIVARAFLDESSQRMEEIRSAIEQHDPQQLQLAAHALKGTIRYYGRTAAYELLYGLETVGASGRLDGAAESFNRLQAEVEALRRHLGSVVARPDDDSVKG